MQHYVIKVVSDLRQVGGFSRYSGLLHQKKTNLRDIAEILVKVALNIINQSTYNYTTTSNWFVMITFKRFNHHPFQNEREVDDVQ